MIKLLFLLPIIMCLLWYAYLRQHGWSITQGKGGFAYIISFNLVIALTLWLLMLLTAK